jgi:hypothetical protein
MNEDIRKRKAELLFWSITPENVAKIYLHNFNDYLYQNSDEVEINGIVIGNSIEDKIMKIKMRFPDKNGNPNIKTAKACGTRAGFPITELDFIDNQLTILKGLSFIDFVQRKKYETYLNFILNKETPPQPEPILTNTPQQRNIKNQLQKEINHFFFFQIEVVENVEIDGKTYENQKQLNNESIITTENWNERKLEFFNQRMNIYKVSFSQTEKIELEIELLNKFEFEKNDYKILKNRYLELLKDNLINEPEKSNTKKHKTELSIKQIALKYVYEYSQITRENGNKIAKEYGHNSGEKLFQQFTYFSSLANRKGLPNPCTAKKLDNKIKLLESVIEILSIDKQNQVKDEVSILKKIYESEYQ